MCLSVLLGASWVKVANFFAEIGGKHVDPPPPVVIHEWSFGSAGKPCALV